MTEFISRAGSSWGYPMDSRPLISQPDGSSLRVVMACQPGMSGSYSHGFYYPAACYHRVDGAGKSLHERTVSRFSPFNPYMQPQRYPGLSLWSWPPAAHPVSSGQIKTLMALESERESERRNERRSERRTKGTRHQGAGADWPVLERSVATLGKGSAVRGNQQVRAETESKVKDSEPLETPWLRRNRLAINRWLPLVEQATPASWLLQKPLAQQLGIRWQELPDHEQRQLVDQLRQHLCHQPFDLKAHRQRAVDVVMDYLQSGYPGCFQKGAPQTAALLKDRYGAQGLISPRQVMGAIRQSLEPELGRANAAGFFSHKADWTLTQWVHWQAWKSMVNMEKLGARTAQLIRQSPLEAGFAVSRRQASALLAELTRAGIQAELLQHRLKEPVLGLYRAMAADSGHQRQQLVGFMAQLAVNSQDNPLGPERWQKVKTNELKVALAVVDKKLQQQRAPSESLIRVRQALQRELGHVSRGEDGYDQHPEHSPLRADDYAEAVGRYLVENGVSPSLDRVRQTQDRVRATVLRQGWEPVRRRLAMTVGGRSSEYVSEIIPASAVRLSVGSQPTFGAAGLLPYKPGEGVPSLCKAETEHGVNLNETGFYQAGSAGSALFQGVRSGTVGPGPGVVHDREQRREIALKRAREVLAVALKQALERDPDKWDQALRGQAIPLKLASTSLLSTDTVRDNALVRYLVSKGLELGLQDNELQMQQEQVEAFATLEALLARGECLDIRDAEGKVHSVRVNLETAHFNFGVNPLSLKRLGEKEHNYGRKGLAKRFIGLHGQAWQQAPKYNIQALQTLIGPFDQPEPWQPGGWVADFLDRPEVDSQEKRIVRQLARQIRALYQTEDYKTEGEDAYKMVSRIILLAYKVGAIPHFNCKSGKDRTGEADASVKRLAAEVAALGYVPDPWAPVSREEQLRTQICAWKTGNMELLQQNVNRPGYKVETGMARLGPAAWEKLRFACRPEFESTPFARQRGLFAEPSPRPPRQPGV